MATRIELLEFPVDSVSMEDALDRVDEFVASRQPHQIMVSNANKLWQMHRNPRLAAIMRKADLVIPEKAVVIGAAVLGTPLKAHVGGSMLAEALLPHSEKMGHSIFFLGARQAVLESLVEKVRRTNPGLRIAGYHHGYFRPHGEEELRSAIRAAKPDILLVALGSPLQEYWIHDHVRELGVPVSIGVGGTFDVLAGIKKDAPPWVRKCSIEWLYRLVQDPRNLWKRYLTTIPWFLYAVLTVKIRGRKPRIVWSKL
jgi:N-acetylglucosaminyldiphosphoundecaprenol N-acetyl-beta-D-mannosaminyltransferase